MSFIEERQGFMNAPRNPFMEAGEKLALPAILAELEDVPAEQVDESDQLDTTEDSTRQ